MNICMYANMLELLQGNGSHVEGYTPPGVCLEMRVCGLLTVMSGGHYWQLILGAQGCFTFYDKYLA